MKRIKILPAPAKSAKKAKPLLIEIDGEVPGRAPCTWSAVPEAIPVIVSAKFKAEDAAKAAVIKSHKH